MNTPIRLYLLIFVVSLIGLPLTDSGAQNDHKNIKVGPQPDGSFLVPTNQLLRPAGFQVYFPGRPVDLALSADKKFLIVKNKGSIDIIRIQDRTILQSLELKKDGSSFTGLCISKDGRRLFVTDARNKIQIAELDENRLMHWKEAITLPAPSIGGKTVPGGLALNKEESKIYVTLSRNNTLGVVTLGDTTVKEIPVGIAPYEVVLASDIKAYVSNWGGRRPNEGESTYNTSGSQVLVDPQTGIANNGSVSAVDLTTGKQIKDIKVGLHPSGMVLSPDRTRLYVACANSDLISVINTAKDEVIEEISVHMQKNLPFGSPPMR